MFWLWARAAVVSVAFIEAAAPVMTANCDYHQDGLTPNQPRADALDRSWWRPPSGVAGRD
jgi:hypothetical protein